ncbi:SCO family protein [Rheinheimera marina]|uniref:SCO family protein n=1 Tax=Rheinheimera marina TaxID=1774958 RepID=A0ABV9JGQ3_9GAMM
MNKYALWVVLVLALLAGVWLSQMQAGPKQPQQAVVYPKARPLTEFSLLDQQGQPAGLEALRGQWTLVFVGYTSCPDICPLTMAKLAGLQPKLQQMTSTPVQVWFVSVDPKRDTPTQLAQYVQHFNQPALKAFTADHPALFPFVRQLGLMYAIPQQQEGHYLVDHSASIALISPKADVVAMFKPEMKAGQPPLVNSDILLADFPLVLERSEG